MKCKITSVCSQGNSIYLAIESSVATLKNLEKVLSDLNLEHSEDFIFRCDSKGEPSASYNPKKYVDDHSFFESKKFKVHLIGSNKKIHIIATVSKTNRADFLNKFQKYFDVVKSK